MDKIEVAVYMPDAEAAKFLLFQEYFEPFNVLIEAGVFQTRNGSIALHFDANGVLQTVQRADTLYSRKHLSTP